MKKWLPFILPGIIALWVLGSLAPKHDAAGKFAAREFGELPILAGGRIQPIDSLARNSLLQLREKQSANTTPWESNPQILSASEWLMEMLMKPETADTRPVFRIDNPDVKGLLGLPMEADKEKKTDGKHYSWNQIKPKLEELQGEAKRIGGIDEKKRTVFDRAVMHLWNGVGIYMRLQNMLEPQNARDWPAELNAFLNNIVPGVAAARAQKAGKEFDQVVLDRLLTDAERFNAMSELDPPMLIPPAHPEISRDKWQRSGDALMDTAKGDQLPFAVTSYARMAGAYRTGNVAEFNQAVADYRTALSEEFSKELSKANHEASFNEYAPFYKAMYPYVLAAILVLFFWLAPNTFEWARRAAVWLVVVGLAVHASGLCFRMALEGRPPVTNLYSSAIFIGFGAVVLGLVLEAFWKNDIGLVISSALGFVSLIIAYHLSLSGDTMEMMRAVLDTNFWLATHVVVVTLGYASTFVAGFLAVQYIILGVFTPNLNRAMKAGTPSMGAAAVGAIAGGFVGGAMGAVSGASVAGKLVRRKTDGQPIGKTIPKMIYGIVCFATLFSFVGTVLGGIWADQSWGRFWGWDPKENGALIIVLWNALILHARWGGMVRDRGLACLAIGGNIVTSWSWFGVNMLGIGLHSYGFTASEFLWLLGFVISQLVLIGIGLLPLSWWRSFREEQTPEIGDAAPAAA